MPHPWTAAELSPHRPVRLALLLNPASGRNRKAADRLLRLARRYPETMVVTATTPAEIRQALRALAEKPPQVLAVNGGDGTVAAVLTVLFNERPFPRFPLLALLPGGTTNMTAADAGMRGPLQRALERLLAWSRHPDPSVGLVKRSVLRIQAGTEAPRFGLFFGTGAIINGIEYCHRKVLRRGVGGGIGPGLCLLRILVALLRGDGRYVTPVPVAVNTTPALPALDEREEYFILLASTLERLFLGLRPYWGASPGGQGLYYSAVGAPPHRPLRLIPPLLWGRAGRHAIPENGYWSGKLDQLTLRLDGTFTIDGELYPMSPDRGLLQVAHTPPLAFLRF